MTADDMEKMAEHAEHMAQEYRKKLEIIPDGLLAAAMWNAMGQYEESARWWREQREKADLR